MKVIQTNLKRSQLAINILEKTSQEKKTSIILEQEPNKQTSEEKRLLRQRQGYIYKSSRQKVQSEQQETRKRHQTVR